MRWQLDSVIRSSRYEDYFFPFEQFGGANVGLVSLLTVSHPVVTATDAENYVVRLNQIAPRLDEAIAEARRIAGLGLIRHLPDSAAARAHDEFNRRSLVYHETVPGHHFQLALELENTDLPQFRQIRAFGAISAFSEGWGLYAERLAAELGWYDDDPEGLLGQLDSALFRARRLVVDTGLHAKQWTRQQAIDYGIEASEVERYVVNPGQACSYMIGLLKIVELREKARAALGSRFSIREFHNVVLGTGSVPLQLLERQVDAYISTAGR
jgi:uncharacterized protein (DUF885 family)